MASQSMAQDVILCDLCETSPVQMYCNSCATKLCNECVSKHIEINPAKDHNMVIFQMKNTKIIYPFCKTHQGQNCEMMCRKCNTPVCVRCMVSGSHKKHSMVGMLELCENHRKSILQHILETKTSVYPKYERTINELESHLKKLPQKYGDVISELSKQGEIWHREIDIIIKKRKEEVEKMKTDSLAIVSKLLKEMRSVISAIDQAIVENTQLLNSNEASKVLDSKLPDFKPPRTADVTIPIFTPLPVKSGKLHQMFGTLTTSSTPINLIEYTSDMPVKSQAVSPTQLNRPIKRTARTLYKCTADHEEELSFEANMIISNVRISKEPGWLEGSLDGKRGLIPENYVVFVD